MKKSLLLGAAALLCIGSVSAKTDSKVAKERINAANVENLLVRKSNIDAQLAPMKFKNEVLSKSYGFKVNLAAKADDKTLSALYDLPDGGFYWGMASDWSAYNVPLVIAPAFADIQYYNCSQNVVSNSWNYLDPTDKNAEKKLTATDIDLSVNYPYFFGELPTLTTTGEGGVTKSYVPSSASGTAGFALYGGSATMDYEKYFGCTSVDFSKGSTTYYATAVGDWWFGTGTTAKSNGIVGMGTLMPKPAKTYVLNNVFVPAANFVAADDAEFTITVFKVNDKGEMTEVIATGTCLGADVNKLEVDPNGGHVVTMPFTLEKESEDGRSEEVTPNIDSAIFIAITGYQSDKVTSMAMRINSGGQDVPNYYGYFLQSNGENINLIPLAEAFENPLWAAPSIFMDITYTWLNCDEKYFMVPNEGGSKDFTVDSYYYSEAWSIGEELPSWLKAEGSDDQTNQVSHLILTAEALPSDVQGRSHTLTLRIPGASKTFIISQGLTGVESVEVAAANVAVVDGNFVITNAGAATTANLYNVAGQLVKTVAVSDGAATVDAQSLASGMYIFRFDNNTTVKVIK